MDADGEVRGADGPRPDADRRPAGQLAVRLRHEGRRTLVTGGHDPDPGSIEAIKQPEKAFAGNREGVADADGAEGVGDVPTDGPDRFGDGFAWGRGLRVGPGLGPRFRFRVGGFG